MWRTDQLVRPVHVKVDVERLGAVDYTTNTGELGKSVAVELDREAVQDNVVVVDDLHLRSGICK